MVDAPWFPKNNSPDEGLGLWQAEAKRVGSLDCAISDGNGERRVQNPDNIDGGVRSRRGTCRFLSALPHRCLGAWLTSLLLKMRDQMGVAHSGIQGGDRRKTPSGTSPFLRPRGIDSRQGNVRPEYRTDANRRS